MRFTKIICTLGPSSSDTPVMEALLHAGMNVARINMSHGSPEKHRAAIQAIHAWNERRVRTKQTACAIMIDTKGGEIRTGDTDNPIPVAKDEEVIFSSALTSSSANKKTITVNYSGFGNDVRETDRILLDNGEIMFDIVRIHPNGDVVARARQDGKIGSRRHINLPGANVDLPSITDQDWKDIAFGMERNVDFVALSFIRNRDDIEAVRSFIAEKKGHTEIVAKIETKQSVENIVEIIHAADAIMIARGDLGAELPFEQIPVIQDEIVRRSREIGKPVIIATHMLESMIINATPTRAEVTDIAHAAVTGTDATMLSGETAAGRHPVIALEAMDRVLRATEEHLLRFGTRTSDAVLTDRQARAEAACTLSESTGAKALIVFTRTGQSARDLSKFRPRIPILSFTDMPDVQRKLALSYGVMSYCLKFSADPESTVTEALAQARGSGLLQTGDRVVVVSDAKAHEQLINTVQLRVA
ncbi:MAG: pyruvate kinase [Patescibacteria group bacterium]